MLHIKCPWCGKRAETEYTYKGDATMRRPDPAVASDEEWLDHIYLRDNPAGNHDEFWQHSSGCRQFVKVRRNLKTHAILRTGAPDEQFPEDPA
jgi:methylglutamate dehydrogenase subunit B